MISTVRQLMAADARSTVEEIEHIVERGVSDAFIGLVSDSALPSLCCLSLSSIANHRSDSCPARGKACGTSDRNRRSS